MPRLMALTSAAKFTSRHTNTTLNVNLASYDGICYYPTPDPDFPGLEEYLGRWYQVAGTVVPFTLGCSCIFAEYSLNTDGTVNVTNACQLGVLANNIQGTASPVDPAYGAAALQVRFDSVPGAGIICPGPNYIIQKYDPDWAIVQSPSFSELFLLSRVQNPSDTDIDAWLLEAKKLGTNLSTVTKFSQENCLFT